jgi:tetratricopeptide (TPR) repeat protein
MYKIIICFVISGLFFSCAKNETDRNSINEQEGAPVSESSSGNILLNNYDETVPYIIGVKNDDLTLQKALEKEFKGVYSGRQIALRERLTHEQKEMLENAKYFYSLALNYYNNKDYKNAVENYTQACNNYTFEVVYYQLGVCLFDMGDLENAKKAFEKALSVYCYNEGMETFVTTDSNGIKRETYFSFYNLACIESLRNNIAKGYEYLEKALYCGYPYMEHLKNDADLDNVLTANDGSYLESLEEIYNNRAENPFVGKAYSEYLGGAAAAYYFIDPLRMIVSSSAMNFPVGIPNIMVVEYYIKDNEIVMSKRIEIITYVPGTGVDYSVRINIDDLTNPLLKVYNNQRFTEIPIGNFNHFYPLKLSLMEWEEEYGYE